VVAALHFMDSHCSLRFIDRKVIYYLTVASQNSTSISYLCSRRNDPTTYISNTCFPVLLSIWKRPKRIIIGLKDRYVNTELSKNINQTVYKSSKRDYHMLKGKYQKSENIKIYNFILSKVSQ